jgi:hypothetical protein
MKIIPTIVIREDIARMKKNSGKPVEPMPAVSVSVQARHPAATDVG